MSRRISLPAKALLMLAGFATMIGFSKILAKASSSASGPREICAEPAPPPDHVARGDAGRSSLDSKRRELASYGIGYVLASLLTCAAFALVYWRWASGATALAVVSGLALVQALVHFRCFLHVSLKRSARDDLQLILFSTVIVCLMVGGTFVVLFNLHMRMM